MTTAPSAMIDLRSDTVTQPTPSMRQAMQRACVGDDVFGEDPSVRLLEEEVADRLGTQAALFVPSGTMGNQLAIGVQTRKGDEIIVGQGAHCAWYESGAASALWGVQAVSVGHDGCFDGEHVSAAVKPRADWYPQTRLVAVENTHNRAGGRVWRLEQLASVLEASRRHGLSCHMDGARIWNAAVALGVTEKRIATGFDTVSVCFSKGLGAPVGSALCASHALIEQARRLRKRLGGGMRQAGFLAAAARFALQQHRERLVRDHDNAKALARIVASAKGAQVDLEAVQTNIVMVDTPTIAAEQIEVAARAKGVLVAVFGAHRIRLVTHLDVEETAQRGGQIVAEVIETLQRLHGE
ncbi:MAG TPA: GntG family PLP-dependent aldolase [Polyangiaceae bacterium]|jgi:threonine aldolase|nr:MAG: L-allo-threonine aldolase [Deltaproteobacteria bacterium ADurb.Bin207]HNS98965.1 GntG family PLP-dependent aldolase [Polyangiaceae bacterium]HNZ24474.1 GntG family PLP-dependent aldolase [Polyangiaceae bacterium]HOD22923.1 GntG family PLP-dependent aldolase [Polyangiaceae bacterium]HOE50118.1 GntG family PLP-dependent aldolase [Polyangiaceae bacterium]